MILVSLIAITGLLAFFSCFYNRFYVINADDSSAKICRKSIFEYCSLHMIYAINIMTNQGNRLNHFHSSRTFSLV